MLVGVPFRRTPVRHTSFKSRTGPVEAFASRPSGLVGRSVVMEAVRKQLTELAASPWHGRIEGPRGSGKGLAARLVHAGSPRASRPFVRQSMSTLPPGLELARLCGWSRGAFTGAVADVPGVMEDANGGTLFLDEIAWSRKRVRGALLQLLEDAEVWRIGERRARKVDVRFLFGTNADLEAEAAAGPPCQHS
jgi:DNA-binding NtrC family response regulator